MLLLEPHDTSPADPTDQGPAGSIATLNRPVPAWPSRMAQCFPLSAASLRLLLLSLHGRQMPDHMPAQGKAC